MNCKLDETDRLKHICKKCEFRRELSGGSYYNGESRRDSRCACLDITGETRDCVPTDKQCEKFRPRVRTRSLTVKVGVMR